MDWKSSEYLLKINNNTTTIGHKSQIRMIFAIGVASGLHYNYKWQLTMMGGQDKDDK